MKRIWLITVLAVLAGAAACQKDPFPGPEPVDPVVEPEDPAEPEEPEKPVPPELRIAYKAIDSTRYERTDFAEWAYSLTVGTTTERAFNMFLQPKCKDNNEKLNLRIKEESGQESPAWGYWDYILKYESTDASGAPVTLSERVIFPTGFGFEHRAKGLLLANHPTIFSNAECPTEKRDYLFGLASLDYVAVFPDLQGFGVSRERVHPYLCAELTARQSLDGLLAVLHFLGDREIALQEGRELMNIGYSQGGASALAFHKYLENNCEDDVKAVLPLKASYCGGGPYDLALTMQEYAGQEDLSYPCVLPLILIGMKEGFPDLFAGLEPESFFPESVLKASVLAWTRDKEHTADQITSRIRAAAGTHKMEGMLSPALQDPESRESKALAAALAANDLTVGWKPVRPVYFCHVEKDEIVPYANLQKVMDGLSGGDIHLLDNFVPLMPTHVGGAASMYLRLLDGFPE